MSISGPQSLHPKSLAGLGNALPTGLPAGSGPSGVHDVVAVTAVRALGLPPNAAVQLQKPSHGAIRTS
jgi:hypothetical protein